ncbi:MAG: ABC transporter substrate-binding protein [Anaerolineales bacterium]|nr:ABC transporter substrate-binding protein [Anaerolineales bacterium]
MKKRAKIYTIMLLSLILLSACGTQAGETEQGELQILRLPMGYIPNIQQAPLYVAVEKGYFAEAGIALDFDYSFETDGVALVGSNEVQFALVSGEQVLLARAQGIPVVYILGWYQHYPVAVVAKQESGIETLEDLRGKTVGLPGLFGANYIGLEALLEAADIPESELTLESVGYNQVEALASDQVDAVSVYENNEPIQLRAQGYDINVIPVSDYLQLASNGVITNATMIAENPDLVRRFLGAFMRGIEDTIADPDEAFELSKPYIEGLEENAAVQKQVLAKTIEYWQVDALGYSNPQAWENMQDVLLNMGLLSAPLDLDAAYTNEFIAE